MNNQLTKDNITFVLKKLSESGLLFLSEEDFKFRFAIAFKEMYKESEFIFDYKVNIDEKIANDKYKISYIDAIIKYKDKFYPIEFKYKTEKRDITKVLKNNSFNISSEGYELKKHAAQDWGHYRAMKDIWRIEQLINKDTYYISKGFFIFVTNEKSYYQDNKVIQKQNNSYKNFAVAEGRKIEKGKKLEWEKDVKSKKILLPFKFDLDYEIFTWKTFYEKKNDDIYDEFRYLLVEVKK